MSNSSSQHHLSPATRAAQALRLIDERSGAVVPGIEFATTFARDEEYELRLPYSYARGGGPTVDHLEAILQSLDDAAASLAFSSGMGVVVAMAETLNSGDHLVAQQVMYHGAVDWFQRLSEKRGIEVSFFDQSVPGSLQAALRPGQTRMVWVETPANPSWDIIDITEAADAAHAAGAVLVVDSTVAPACTTATLALGADFVFQSATKYLGGHSDLLAGTLSCREITPLWQEIGDVRARMGTILSPYSAWLLIRGIRTLFVRYELASANALRIAAWLAEHPAIERVLYPGLPSHPGHDVAARQMENGFGGMLSVLLKDGEAAARDLARFCQVFLPATSLGGVESLIEHRISVEGPNSVVPANLVRISIGIEDAADLIADLEQALDRKR